MALSLSPDDLEALLRSLPDPAFLLTASGRYAAIFGGTDTRYYHDGSGLTDDGPDQPIWFEGRVTRLPFPVQGEPAVLWVASNTTHRHALEVRLRALSETDELTGLANRRRFMAELRAQFDAFARYGQPAAVIYLDIDRFKAINDDLGHGEGDAALCAVADALRARLRKTDLAARLGGDEFVVLCAHTGAAEAEGFAERLREPLSRALRSFALSDGPASVSVGWAAMAFDDAGPDDVLRRADEGLYRAKRRGR